MVDEADCMAPEVVCSANRVAEPATDEACATTAPDAVNWPGMECSAAPETVAAATERAPEVVCSASRAAEPVAEASCAARAPAEARWCCEEPETVAAATERAPEVVCSASRAAEPVAEASCAARVPVAANSPPEIGGDPPMATTPMPFAPIAALVMSQCADQRMDDARNVTDRLADLGGGHPAAVGVDDVEPSHPALQQFAARGLALLDGVVGLGSDGGTAARGAGGAKGTHAGSSGQEGTTASASAMVVARRTLSLASLLASIIAAMPLARASRSVGP